MTAQMVTRLTLRLFKHKKRKVSIISQCTWNMHIRRHIRSTGWLIDCCMPCKERAILVGFEHTCLVTKVPKYAILKKHTTCPFDLANLLLFAHSHDSHEDPQIHTNWTLCNVNHEIEISFTISWSYQEYQNNCTSWCHLPHYCTSLAF